MEYLILDWDTDFFGVKVAKILIPNLSLEQLRNVLSDLDRENVKLVYWPADKEVSLDVIQSINGQLVDRRTSFEINLQNLNPSHYALSDLIEKYEASMDASELEKLAIQSGEYSRFSVDQNIGREKFEALYKSWIRKSLSKEIADEVFVIRDKGSIAGMVTLGNKNGKGSIDLLAVDVQYRGKKYGETLVRAAQGWFIKNGYEMGVVVTQKNNIPACNLYKKNGYSVSSVEYFYHFYL
ncbi:MAG: dTDP-4-amino-4,6-dideoxy-D-galactose acyltransferase [Chlamydiales bacterium]|jgi:dTDP-4-amino-4,6-dideoxy-D-galactose acyltransferase